MQETPDDIEMAAQRGFRHGASRTRTGDLLDASGRGRGLLGAAGSLLPECLGFGADLRERLARRDRLAIDSKLEESRRTLRERAVERVRKILGRLRAIG
jgi:hypothetical protein